LIRCVAGEEDQFLPSVEEAYRLNRALKRSEVVVLPRVGHAALLNPAVVDFTSLIKQSLIYSTTTDDTATAATAAAAAVKQREPDAVYDFVLNTTSPEYARAARDALQSERLLSPIFLSISADGQLQRGLGGVPANSKLYDSAAAKPLLFVGNHQLLALDLSLIVSRLLEEKNILARGLAHPVVMAPAAVAARQASAAAIKASVDSSSAGSSTSSSSSSGSSCSSRVLQQLGLDEAVVKEVVSSVWTTRDARNAAKREADAAVASAERAARGEPAVKASDMGDTFKAFGAVTVSPRK
jgi:hypothetical protein